MQAARYKWLVLIYTLPPRGGQQPGEDLAEAQEARGGLLQGFVKGAYAAAIGTILGACLLLGKIAIGDWLTAVIAVLSLAALVRWQVRDPMLIAATALIGLIAFPLLKPTWIFVKQGGP